MGWSTCYMFSGLNHPCLVLRCQYLSSLEWIVLILCLASSLLKLDVKCWYGSQAIPVGFSFAVWGLFLACRASWMSQLCTHFSWMVVLGAVFLPVGYRHRWFVHSGWESTEQPFFLPDCTQNQHLDTSLCSFLYTLWDTHMVYRNCTLHLEPWPDRGICAGEQGIWSSVAPWRRGQSQCLKWNIFTPWHGHLPKKILLKLLNYSSAIYSCQTDL